jgi:hypothetical protein
MLLEDIVIIFHEEGKARGKQKANRELTGHVHSFNFKSQNVFISKP